MFPDTASHHLVFELRERQHEVVFSDQLVVHILELPKFTKLAEELTTPLDLWLFFLRHAEHLDIEALPGALEIPEVQRAIKELLMLTQTDEERERYESRRNYQREVYTAIAEAKDLGRAEGVATGRVIGKIQAFQQLLHRTPTAEAELANLPLEELNRRARELEVAITQQLAPPQ
jgi:predicted transposase/invertase (TIGR01784 family)